MKTSLAFSVLLIILCGFIEVTVLFLLKIHPSGEDKLSLAALTISVSAILSVFLIVLTNRQANKFGKLYLSFLCIKFLKLSYEQKIKYGADKIISNLVVDPIKVYRNVFSSFFMCIYAAVYFVSGLIGSVLYLGVSGIILPAIVIILYSLLLVFSKATMKKMGDSEYHIQNSMIQSLNLYSSNVKGYYSYRLHDQIFESYIHKQEQLLNNIYRQSIINQVPKSAIIVFILIIVSIYILISGRTDLKLSTDQTIGVLLLLKTAGPAQLLFTTSNNIVYFSRILKPLFSDMKIILSNRIVLS